ncbi:MAG: hypothetical protein LDL31_05300 [Prosthecobacter sp.]|nr:hypothetical protein [Prosthecobacter sp.]
MTAHPILPIATALFGLSGLAALIYQTCWQRMLVLFAGGDVQAVTLIVAAFMLGMGCGHAAGGWLADRRSQAGCLALFALLELGIAAWAMLSPWLYHDLLCQRLAGLAEAPVTGSIVVILLLLPPTWLMGMSLPLLARAISGSLQMAPTAISQLYGMNTLGAALGAILCTWCLMPRFGIEGAVRHAAALNALCALGVLPLLPLARGMPEPKATQSAEMAHDAWNRLWAMRRFRLCLGLHAASGFLAIGLELLWFRVLGVMLKSTAFTFGTLLGIYLGGLALGSLVGARLVKKGWQPLKVFLWLQAAVGLYAGLGLGLLLALVHLPALQSFTAYLDLYEPLDVNTSLALLLDPSLPRSSVPDPWLLPLLHGLLPAVLIVPATFLIGMAFPFLQKAAQTDLGQLGLRTGSLQVANIVGNVAGALLVGFLLLDLAGSALTLKLMVLLSTGLGLIALLGTARLRFNASFWLSASLAVLLLIPDADTFWARIHGSQPDQFLHVEDRTGVAGMKQVRPSPDLPGESVVFVNGIGQSWLPYGGIHSILGALPALLHPKPERIAIIGLGSGDTAYCAAPRHMTEEVACIEIIGGQLTALRRHQAQHPNPSSGALLADKRINHHQGDGRRFLATTRQQFDIIEADALRPNSAGSGILYSEEFFQLVKKRLRPGGYAVTWVPSARVRHTFLKVFPHVLDFGVLAIGSQEPIEVSEQDLRRRLTHMEVRHHFRLAGVDVQRLLTPFTQVNFKSRLIGPDHDRTTLGEVNTDLFPRDEFHLPALWGTESAPQAKTSEEATVAGN